MASHGTHLEVTPGSRVVTDPPPTPGVTRGPSSKGVGGLPLEVTLGPSCQVLAGPSHGASVGPYPEAFGVPCPGVTGAMSILQAVLVVPAGPTLLMVLMILVVQTSPVLQVAFVPHGPTLHAA